MPSKGNESISSEREIRGYSVEELIHIPIDSLGALDKARLEETPAHILASFLERIDVDERRAVLRKLSVEDASEIISEMDAVDSAEVIAAMREWRALKILEELDPDDATDLLYELKERDQKRLLDKLNPQTAADVRKLLKYDPHTAGGVMTPYFMYVHPNMSITEATNHIRKHKEDFDHTSYLYAIDTSGHLKGVLTMRSLLLATPNEKIADIMNTNIQGICGPDEDSEKIALKMAELNFHALPVVDSEGRILGIVEHDDVIDIIQEEATEDFQKIVGAGADETIHTSVLHSIKRRLPWLLVNLLTASLATLVVSHFQGEIHQLSLLAVFIPLMASLGGNTGAQSLAIAIRSIALGEIETSDNFAIFVNEALKGLINGLIIGVVAGLVTLLFTQDLNFSLVLFSSLALTMSLAGTIGAVVPLLLKHLKLDPAQSSSIFLTAINDSCSSLIFLSIGTWLLL